MVSVLCLFLAALLSHGALDIVCAADPVLPRVVIRHHELFVQIVPEQHALIAKDRLTLEVPQQKTPIRLSLAPTLQIDRIALVQESAGTESRLSMCRLNLSVVLRRNRRNRSRFPRRSWLPDW